MRQHVRDIYSAAGSYVAINGRRMLPAFLFISTSTISWCWAWWEIGARTALADAEARLEKEAVFCSATPLRTARNTQTIVSGDICFLIHSWRSTVKPLHKSNRRLSENHRCRWNFFNKKILSKKKAGDVDRSRHATVVRTAFLIFEIRRRYIIIEERESCGLYVNPS